MDKRKVFLRLKREADVGRIHKSLTTEWSEATIPDHTLVALQRAGEVEVRFEDPREIVRLIHSDVPRKLVMLRGAAS